MLAIDADSVFAMAPDGGRRMIRVRHGLMLIAPLALVLAGFFLVARADDAADELSASICRARAW